MASANLQNSTTKSPPETISGMAISLAFWFCLLIAASLFAVVALSPKFLSYLRLRQQYDANQLHLVALERQGAQLQRVIDAIRCDKDFAAELTRIEFDAVRPGEEVIPVDVDLKLDASTSIEPLSDVVTTSPWYEPTVYYLASDAKFRMMLLGAAAVLVVISFSLLQPAGAIQVSTGARNCNSIWRSLRNRYVRRMG
jgi:hypothetical protein